MLDWLKEFLNGFWDLLYSALVWILDALIYICLLIVKLTFSGFCVFVYGVVSALDFGSLLVNLSAQWGYLNPNIAYMLVQSGVPTGLSWLSIAYIVRFTLNLIPAAFTRV